MQAVAESH